MQKNMPVVSQKQMIGLPVLAAVLFFLKFLVESVYIIYNIRRCMFVVINS